MALPVQHDVNLFPFNAFALTAMAKHWLQTSDINLLKTADFRSLTNELGVRVLGGGTNIVLLEDINELVIQYQYQSIANIFESTEKVHYRVSAGVAWHDWVCFTIQQGLSGFENLALIPGTVGAAPIQNIGAYGVELADQLLSVEALYLPTSEICKLTAEECCFGYRHSFFKEPEQRQKWLILSVELVCDKHFKPKVAYADLAAWFQDRAPTLQAVFDAVVSIRQAKLPDPKVLPNVGSFFKNPQILESHFLELKKVFPGLKGFPQHRLSEKQLSEIKVSAAQLIELCGLKSQRCGGIAVDDAHALVLVNSRQGTAAQLLELISLIQACVWRTFQINLQPEPELWSSNVTPDINK